MFITSRLLELTNVFVEAGQVCEIKDFYMHCLSAKHYEGKYIEKLRKQYCLLIKDKTFEADDNKII